MLIAEDLLLLLTADDTGKLAAESTNTNSSSSRVPGTVVSNPSVTQAPVTALRHRGLLLEVLS
jgi:hypothetical protein